MKAPLNARLVPAALAAAGLAVPALAQRFHESFDNVGPTNNPGEHGPSGLLARGWQFRNQSNPIGWGYWVENSWSYQGAAALYISSDVVTWQNTSSAGSSWALLPAIAGQTGGDPLKFAWNAGAHQVFESTARLQVRYSPGGGTSTGSGPNDVGDYTVLLGEYTAPQGAPWSERTLTLPGSGRIAFRLYQPPQPTEDGFLGSFTIDEVKIGAVSGSPPVPQPGQTVRWTAPMSPITISSHTIIPAGGTVVVDPGVQVRIVTDARLFVEGRIEVQRGAVFNVATTAGLEVKGGAASADFTGTAQNPVRLEGGAAWLGNSYRFINGATARMRHVASDAMLYVGSGSLISDGPSSLVAANMAFTGAGSGLYVEEATLALRDASITDGYIEALESYLLFDRLTLERSFLKTYKRKAAQPVYLNTITARNLAGDAPFQLNGFDHFFGTANTITGNLYPVHLIGGGIAPGSTLPATGNINNYIHGGIGEFQGRNTFANVGLPYRIDWDSQVPWMGGDLRIEPGVTVRLGPAAYLWATYGSDLDIDGRPGAPVRFERFDPNQPWHTVNYALNGTLPRPQFFIIDGAERGLIADSTVVRSVGGVFTNNEIGAFSSNTGQTKARSCRFIGNHTGVMTSYGLPGNGFYAGHADLDGFTNPNIFENNGIAFDVLNPWNFETAKGNWWGDSSGPRHPTNPGGQGELVQGNALVLPFRTVRPDTNDHPPLIRLRTASWLMEEGRRIHLSWDAEDDGQISSFNVYYQGHSDCTDVQPLLIGLPGTARSAEITVPPYEHASCLDPAMFRVVAVDDAGQENHDDTQFFTPYIDFVGGCIPEPITRTLRPGEVEDICYNVLPGSSGTTDIYLFLDADNWALSLGGAHTGVTCQPLGLTVPPVSTDTARIGVRYNAGASGRSRWDFTPYFSIRPDPAIGDAPPTVQLTAPAPGAVLRGGSTAAIEWTASDDEALRAFKVQASYDAGRTWHFISGELPGSARRFDWSLPASEGISDVRVRVIAIDLRFQDSSSGADRPLSIVAGQGCYADCDTSTGLGNLDIFDFLCFQNRFTSNDPYACDCDTSTGPGSCDVFDFLCFQNAFAAGCP